MFWHYLAFLIVLGFMMRHNFHLKKEKEEWKVKALKFEYEKKKEVSRLLMGELEECFPTDPDLANQKEELISRSKIGWLDPPGISWRSSDNYELRCYFEDMIAAAADNLLLRMREQEGTVR